MLARQKRWLALFMALFLFAVSPAHALVVFQDTFDTDTQIDPSSTTFWDEENELVRLPLRSLPNSLTLAGMGEYIVAQRNQVSWYAFDAASGQMKVVNELSVPATDPLGVAVKPNTRAYWVFDEDSITRYDFNGSGMVQNPFLSLSGLTGVLSVSGASHEEAVAVLSQDSDRIGEISLYEFTGSGLSKTVTFSTGIRDPVSVAMVPGTFDLIVAGKDEYGYFQYDGSSYIKNPFLSVSGLTDVMAVDDQDGEVKVLTRSDIQHYAFDGTTMSSVPFLSLNPLPEHPITLSALPSGGYDFAYLDEKGEVHYYQFDGTKLVENTALGVTGMNVHLDYERPKVYQSVVIPTGTPVNAARLTVTENNDPTGTIVYEISTDGGKNWEPILPGAWQAIDPGTQVVLRGTFDSVDILTTPRLLDVLLELTSVSVGNLIVTDIVFPGPSQVDPLPDNTYPVYVRAGSEVTFTVETGGFVQQVIGTMTNGDVVVFSPMGPTSKETNVWEGKYVPPLSLADGTVLGITVEAIAEGGIATLNQDPFVQVEGSVLEEFQVVIGQ